MENITFEKYAFDNNREIAKLINDESWGQQHVNGQINAL